MPLTSVSSMPGQPPPEHGSAAFSSSSPHHAGDGDVNHHSSPPSSSPHGSNGSPPVASSAAVGSSMGVRDSPVQQRSTSSPPPPPHTPSTARCSSHQHGDDGDSDDFSGGRRKKADRQLEQRDRGRGGASGRGARKAANGGDRGSSGKGKRLSRSGGIKGSGDADRYGVASRSSSDPPRDPHTDTTREGETALLSSTDTAAEDVRGAVAAAPLTSGDTGSRLSSARARRQTATPQAAAPSASVPTKKVRLVSSRAVNSLRGAEKKHANGSALPPPEVAVVPDGIRARSISTSSRSTPYSSPPSSTLQVAGTTSMRSASSTGSALTSARFTAPPSARGSVVVEAFLLGVQNCLNRQEILFQQLNAQLNRIDSKSPSAFANSRTFPFLSNRSPLGNGRDATQAGAVKAAQRHPLSLSPPRDDSSDGDRADPLMRYSVGTPINSPPPHTLNTVAATRRGNTRSGSSSRSSSSSSPAALLRLAVEQTSAFSAQHTSYASAVHSPSGSEHRQGPSAPAMMPSFVPSPSSPSQPAQSFPSTPSGSVVVVHPTLERGAAVVAAAPLRASPPPLQEEKNSKEGQPAPNCLRLENIAVKTRTGSPTYSAQPPAAADDSCVPTTPMSPAHLQRTQMLQVPENNNNNSGSGGDSNAPVPPPVFPNASFSLHHLDLKQTEEAQSTAPQRRSSGVQWEGGGGGGAGHVEAAAGVSPRLPTPPPFAAATTRGGSSTPRSALVNPPPLPALANFRASSSGTFFPGDSHALWSVSPRSAATPTAATAAAAAAAGSANQNPLRHTTMSSALSLLTSIDSVTLSPLSRPASVMGGSPMAHSMVSAGSPGQPYQQHPQYHQRQQQQQQLSAFTTASSFNSSSGVGGGGLPAGLLSPPNVSPRVGHSQSPSYGSGHGADRPHAGALRSGGAATPPVADSSPYSPLLFQFVSPPSAAPVSLSNEWPPATEGAVLRPLELQPAVLSASASTLSDRNATAAALPSTASQRARDAAHELVSPLSPAPSSASATSSSSPTMRGRRGSAGGGGRPGHQHASESLTHCNSASFVSAASLEDGEVRGLADSHSPLAQPAVAAQLPACLRPDGDGDRSSDPSAVAVTAAAVPSSPERRRSDLVGPHGTADAAVPSTHRQLSLSVSPSVERSDDGREEAAQAAEASTTPTAKRALDVDAAEEDTSATTTVAAAPSPVPHNPFALPPPPSSLSELHAHQQRRRHSAAPVPTMRRPPMVPVPVPQTLSSSAGVDEEGEAAGAAVGGDAAQQERWLSFERQHEQMHLPACWRDSEVVVVDHVEEEDRERDAEEEAARLQLLMEAEMMSSWPLSLSGSEQESSQTEEGPVQSPRSGRGRDEEGEDGEDTNNPPSPEREAQNGKAVAAAAQQRRRNGHAPRYRGLNAYANTASSSSTSVSADALGEEPAAATAHANEERSDTSAWLQSASPEARSRPLYHLPERADRHGGATTTMDSTAGEGEDAQVLRRADSPVALSPKHSDPHHHHRSSEAPRAFRRGNSAPTVASDGNTADWQSSLQARFNELRHIQQHRVHAGDDAASSSTVGGASAETISDAVDRDSGDGSYQRTNSGGGGARLRRRRNRVPARRGSPSAETTTEAAERQFVRSVNGNGGDGGVALPGFVFLSSSSPSPPAAADPPNHHDVDGAAGAGGGGSVTVPSSSSSMSAAAVQEMSRRQTVAFRDRDHGEESRGSEGRDAPAVREGERQAKDGHSSHGSGEHHRHIDESKNNGVDDDEGAYAVGGLPAWSAGADARGDANRRSSSAPTSQPSMEAGTTPDRPHRTNATAVLKEPPAFIASPQHAVVTVEASHSAPHAPSFSFSSGAAAPTAAGTSATPSEVPLTASSSSSASQQAQPSAAEDEAQQEEGEEQGEERDSFSASEVDAAGRTVSAPSPSRATRTPRLRFMLTPRGGTAQPSAIGRARRVVILHSKSTGSAAAHAAAPDALATDAAVPTGKPKKKKKRAAALNGLDVNRRRRHPSAELSSASTTRRGGQRQAAEAEAEGRAGRKKAAQASAGAAAEPTPGLLTLSVAQLAASAMDGGEVAEPGPQSTSHHLTQPVEQVPLSAVGGGVTSASATPKAERKPKKASAASASTTTATTAAAAAQPPRRKSVGAAEAYTRTASASRVVERVKARGVDGADGGGASPRHPSEHPVASTSSAAAAAAAAAAGGGANATGASDSRALLRRLAQRKDRTRAMEERLRLSSGNFSAASAALAVHPGGDDAIASGDSVATAPLRSALRPNSARTPDQTARLAADSDDMNERSLPSLTSSSVTPRPPTAAAAAGGGLVEAVEGQPVVVSLAAKSDTRHVSVVEPNDGPSVTFAASPAQVGGHAATHGSKTAASNATGRRRRRTNLSTRAEGGRGGVGPSSAATTAQHKRGTGNAAGPTTTTAATTSGAGGGSGASAASGSGGPLAFRRGDSARSQLRCRSPLTSSSSPTAEQRRHTIGDVPFSSVTEKRLQPTRTALKRRTSIM